MRDTIFHNYRGRRNVPIGQVATPDIHEVLEAGDDELRDVLSEDETVEGVRERCRIELLIRALGLSA